MTPLRFLSIAAFAFALAHVSLPAQSSVWKISKDGATVYLGGTCHVLRPKDFPLPKEFDDAFAASSKIYFETDLARVQSPEMQQVVMQHGLFTDGTTLDKVLTPAAWANVQTYATNAGLPLGQVMRMRPWFFVVMITMMELQKAGVSLQGVDAHYFQQLAATGKTAGELESFEDHVRFIVTMGAGHESEMLESSFEELNEIPALLEKMLAAWKHGNLPEIDALMLADMKTKYPAIYQSLLLDRNKNWLPRIEGFFKTPEVELVLVGFAHLAGEDGLIAALKTRGYTIEQIKAAPAPAAATAATATKTKS